MTIGIVGCGQISEAYCNTLKSIPALELKACADINQAASASRAQEFGIASLRVEELLADDSIQLVVNLTNPSAHYDVNKAILSAGKHAYSEKPISLTMADALRLVELAGKRGLRLGSAIDTHFGGTHQTAREIVENGVLGQVTSGTAAIMFEGPTHPAPQFFYQKGAGPVFDMGPYHLTHLISYLGPVASVRAYSTTTWQKVAIRMGPNKGKTFAAEVPTHYVGILEFHSGVVVTMIASFDIWRHTHPHIELYGTLGTLSLPDPDFFGGEIRVWKPDKEPELITTRFGYNTGNLRGLGVADMADAIRMGRQHRANAEIALHVLEIMLAFDASSDLGKPIPIRSTCERPMPLAKGELIGGFSGFGSAVAV